MQAKAFNPQIFLEFLCYSVFAGLLLYLARSGKYLSYVTPRMEPYLYFAAIVMVIWALAGLSRLFHPQYKVRSTHCFVLAIPILLLLLPHTALSTSDLSDKFINSSSFSDQSGKSSPQTQTPSGASSDVVGNNPPTEATIPSDSIDTVSPNLQADESEYDYATDLSGLDIESKKITMSNDDFGMWLSEIYTNMKTYEGFTIVMTGFVFKDPEILNEDEFVPARLMMSCCTADLTMAGLLCKYDKASELEAESWVTVEGTLSIGQYEYNGQKYDEPQISVTKITPSEEVEGYVYPYF